MATVSGILIEGLLTSAASRGCSREALCQAMGWDIDSLQGEQLAQRFPIEDFGRLWLQVVEQSGDPSIAYKIGEDISVGEMDILGYVMLSSPTLQDALHYLLRAKRILIDDHLMFVPDGDELAILYLLAEPALPGGRYVHEHACAALIRTCQWLTRTDILPTRIWTTYHAFPAHEDFAETFGVRITTGQRWNACYYKAEDLTLPLVGANENIHALHVEALEKQLEQLLTPVRWSMQVKSKLEDAFLKAETPQLSWVANALGCSERSLQRYLREEGVGFRTLLQGYQRQKASELLLQTNMSTEKIAWKLGFSEASAFSRAFQRWTGCAPGAFRREAEELS